MALFCPLCHSILYFEPSETGFSKFNCLRCSYCLPITRTYFHATEFAAASDAGEGAFAADEFEHAPKIPAVCLHCNNKEAYFMSIQTRSADEPMTQFFVCTLCKKRWRE